MMGKKSIKAWSFGAHILPLIDMFLMWLNSIFEIILSLRIKYDDIINWNNFLMRTILIVGFDLIENKNPQLKLFSSKNCFNL